MAHAGGGGAFGSGSPGPQLIAQTQTMSSTEPGSDCIELSGVAAVVLDLDDTLFPESQYRRSGFEAVAGWLAERLEVGPGLAERMQAIDQTGNRQRVFDEVLAQIGAGARAEELVPQMLACYRAHCPSLALFADAERAIQRWAGVFFTALISDGPEVMQRRKVDALGLWGRLDLVILTDRWGREFWKPHPRAFEEVESACGRNGPACVYIADNCTKDFLAPAKLGWRTVRVCRPGGVYANAVAPAGGTAEFTVPDLDCIKLSSEQA